MKHIFGNICRASVAAAGVMVATSAASAESRPLQFETEFDLDLSLNGVAFEAPFQAPQAATPLTLDVSSAAAGWEKAIGAYLDALLESPAESKDDAKPQAKADAPAAEPTAPPAPAEPASASDKPDSPLIAAEVAAFATPAPAVNPQLLAPVLSQPMHCDQCLAHSAEAAPAETAAAETAPEATIDDDAAWQTLADWAAARAAETAADSADEAVTAESDFFFDVDAAENEPTE